MISSDTRPKESALICARAAALSVGQTNALVASLVLPPPCPFSTMTTWAPASQAVIAATAPAPPQPNTTTSVSSSQRILPASLITGLLLTNFFDREFFKKTFTLQF